MYVVLRINLSAINDTTNLFIKSPNKAERNKLAIQIRYKLLKCCSSRCRRCCHPVCFLCWLLSPSPLALLGRDWPPLTNERVGLWESSQSEARLQLLALCSPCILSLPISPLSNPISFQSKQGEILNTEAKLLLIKIKVQSLLKLHAATPISKNHISG